MEISSIQHSNCAIRCTDVSRSVPESPMQAEANNLLALSSVWTCSSILFIIMFIFILLSVWYFYIIISMINRWQRIFENWYIYIYTINIYMYIMCVGLRKLKSCENLFDRKFLLLLFFWILYDIHIYYIQIKLADSGRVGVSVSVLGKCILTVYPCHR